MKKKIYIVIAVICCTVTACGKENVDYDQSSKIVPKETETVLEYKTTEVEEKIDDVRTVDYAEYFYGLNGCAVVYNAQDNSYSVYNDVMANTEVSPCSTFKIVAVLMGLSNQVIQDENSTMQYNGTQYSQEQWNKNLNLKEAVQYSCVWYFRQVIDAVGKDEVQKELQALEYGNCDITEWEGTNLNPEKELNGFWLGSSLKISPMEQVNVMKQIFQNLSSYSEEQVNTLKNVLLFDEVNGYSIYGKTGTLRNKEGWYVGIAQKGEQEYYFAVYINSDNPEQAASGQKARSIVKDIFQEEQ